MKGVYVSDIYLICIYAHIYAFHMYGDARMPRLLSDIYAYMWYIYATNT